MKKILSLLLSVLLAICFVGCTYKGVETPSGGTSDGGGTSSDDVIEDGYFSVTLQMDGERYIPQTEMSAQWSASDGKSVHRAAFNENGIAKIAGLDGDYSVTINGIPEGQTYNSNIYTATNDDPNIVVTIHEVIPTRITGNAGSDLYNCVRLKQMGTYRAELKGAGLDGTGTQNKIFYMFSPQKKGVYVIESWVPISQDTVNPKLDVYNGTLAYKTYSHTQNDGGPCGTYTKNFYYEVEVDAKMVGNDYTFAIHATNREGVYPTYVMFSLRLDNPDYEYGWTTSSLIVPTENFKKAPEGAGSWTNPEVLRKGIWVFDGSMYQLNPDDGYYHLYDKETETYGPVLYALITAQHRCFASDKDGNAVSFANVQDQGNKALTVSSGKENYLLFILGYATAIYKGYEIPDDYAGVNGYAQYCNSDGAYPVTAEMKDFLQKFAISQLYFMDGQGWAETQLGVYATEDDQWLFACGYYS